MENHFIGSTTADVGVKGSAHCPAIVHYQWITPIQPGHYCLQVQFAWADDANPLNNLGQTNVDVRPLNSPRAAFQVRVRNPGLHRRQIQLEVDAYTIPAPDACDATPAVTADVTGEEREHRQGIARARHADRRIGIPHGWQVNLDTAVFALEPGATRDVMVETVAPDSFAGRMGFNVCAQTGDLLLGGVTLYAERAVPDIGNPEDV
jgi:hypothetical protein